MKHDDEKLAASALATEGVHQAIKLSLGKRGDVTFYTLEASAEQAKSYMPAFGTNNSDFFFGLVQHIVNAGGKGQYPDELGIKFMLGFIQSRAPRDEIEAMVLTQMAATHVAAMRYANRLAHAESLQEQDSAERALNKLMRTFNMHVEAFQRYRLINEQKVVAQHLSVTHGSQAIIGNVTQPRERTVKERGRERPVLRDGRTPMGIIDEPQRAPIPLRRSQKG